LRRLFSLELLRDNGEIVLRRDPAAPAPDPDDLRWLRQGLDRLPERKREAVILHEVEGYSLAEVAEIQRCSLSAAKTRVSRARRELKRLLGGNGVPGKTTGSSSEEKADELELSLE
jgi:RNA polymerase sigma-70 factor (ECF subfamily)